MRSAQTLEAYARPMFEIAWPPMLSVFSQLLETTEDPSLVAFCLCGCQYAIQMSARLDIVIARNTFVTSIVKFTTLDSVRSLQQKHIDAIKIILHIALAEGEYLNESWSQVLLLISRLSRLQLFADGVHTDEIFFSEQPSSADMQKLKRGI
jgi:brefeldin A-inhibited guanine nucleotide-exchange protein